MKKKRFESRQSILTAIDNVNNKSKHLSELADQHGISADGLFAESAKSDNRQDAGTLIKNAQHERSLERKYRKQNNRIPKKLESLKRTLAMFDTEIMTFETSRAVVMQ